MIPRRGLVVLLLALAGAVLTAPTAGATPVDLDPGAVVRVVNANPEARGSTIEVRLGGGVPQHLSFGSATTFVRLAAQPEIQIDHVTIRLGTANAGCMVTVILTAREPAGQAWKEFPECSPQRVERGAASVRFINATTDSGPILLDMGTPDSGQAVEPFSSTQRRQSAAERLALILRSPSGEKLGERVVETAPDTAYTAIWGGGGETPLRLLWIEDGKQPHDPPPVDVPIDTDRPMRPSGAPFLAILALIGAAAYVGRRHLRTIPLVLLLLVTGCTQDRGPEGASPTSRPPPTTKIAVTRPEGNVGAPVFMSAPAVSIEGAITPVNSDAGPTLPDVLPGDEIAWFRGTGRPGEMGTALLAGHVVWGGSPGVFADLAGLHAGSVIQITDDLGRVRTFTVQGSTTLHKGTIDPTLFGFSPEPKVIFVTCSGPVDEHRGLRTQNLLVLATASERPGVLGGK